MDFKRISLLSSLLMILGLSCSNNDTALTTNHEAIKSATLDSIQKETPDNIPPNQDTFELKVSFQEEDIPINEYLAEALQPIRDNFKRINSTTEWTNIQQKELEDTSEGGTVDYYLLNGQVKKIIVHRFGEMGKQISEYYLIDEQLSFVFEKSYEYNRPMYYDSVASQENQDKEVFDLDKAEIIDVRSYFKNNQLLHLVHSLDCGAPFAADYLLEEQTRIIFDYQQLLSIASQKM